MILSGTAYGVILNDSRQLDAMQADLGAAPYRRPPGAPVLYIKPRGCVTVGGAPVRVPAGIPALEIAPTIGLLFGQDASKVAPGRAADAVAAVCLALEVSEPHDSFYRPAIRQRARDGFLPLGAFGAFSPCLDHAEIETMVDGGVVHRWSLARLVRPIANLIADVTEFMTLAAGDMLMVGLPGDAPQVGPGHTVALRSKGLPDLSVRFETEDAA